MSTESVYTITEGLLVIVLSGVGRVGFWAEVAFRFRRGTGSA